MSDEIGTTSHLLLPKAMYLLHIWPHSSSSSSSNSS
jgi:hypothetical protein